MHRLVIVLLLAAALAGCADEAEPADTPTDTTSPPGPPDGQQTMSILGTVQGPDFAPMADVLVTLKTTGKTRVTDALGSFSFHDLEVRGHILEASLDGYQNATTAVAPQQGNATALLRLVPLTEEPRVVPFEYKGSMECAAEYGIITGPCDTVLTRYTGEQALTSTTTFIQEFDPGWVTVAGDMIFDGQAHPGMDGLRIAIRGPTDPDAVAEYEQFARFHDSTSFTFRLDANQNHTGGTAIIPDTVNVLEFEVYPHGHGYHEVCDDVYTGDCFLGVAAAVRVEFELLVSVFYVDPAPEDFTHA